MEDIGYTDTGNINEKWLNNIYENIKKIEEYERLVREGCSSLLDYVQIPLHNRPMVIGLTQFKNLRFIITEFSLLLADLTPTIDNGKTKKYTKILKDIEKAIKTEHFFLVSRFDANRNLIETKTTPFFWETIDVLHNLKVELFKDIKHILYIGTQDH